MRFGEMAKFVREARRKHFEVGAVLPSSKYLARRICQRMAGLPPNARILEAGPGTGAVTHYLIEILRPGDTLVASELNPEFCTELRRRLAEDPLWRSKASQVQIVEGDIENLPDDQKFDAVVCGLPFNNFPVPLVERLMKKLVSLLTPAGKFSYFEYLAIRRVKAVISNKQERERLRGVGAVMAGYRQRLRVGAHPILRNFPPAIVHHLEAPKTAAP